MDLKMNDMAQSKVNRAIIGRITYVEDGYVELTTDGGVEMSFDSLDDLDAYVPPRKKQRKHEDKDKDHNATSGGNPEMEAYRWPYGPDLLALVSRMHEETDGVGQPEQMWAELSEKEMATYIAGLIGMTAEEMLGKLRRGEISNSRIKLNIIAERGNA